MTPTPQVPAPWSPHGNPEHDRYNDASVDPDAALDLAVDHGLDLEPDPGHHPAPTCRECGQAVGADHRAECRQNVGAYLMP